MLGSTQNAVHLRPNPTFHEIVSHKRHEFRTNSPVEIRIPVHDPAGLSVSLSPAGANRSGDNPLSFTSFPSSLP
jgi:hypothetical protein